MESLLEELYYRGFNLKFGTEERRKRMLELSALIERHEKAMKDLLGDSGSELWEKYADCCDELSRLSYLTEFVAGFRLGGRIVMEIFFGAENMELRD